MTSISDTSLKFNLPAWCHFHSVWMILGRTPGGFIIANQYLPQQPTLSDMTKTDLNFALKIEEMFCRIAHSEYRQVIVEVIFMELSL